MCVVMTSSLCDSLAMTCVCECVPVSLVVVLILVQADQLVGTGLVSQQAEVLQRRSCLRQVFQQRLDVSQVSEVKAVNYISIYPPPPLQKASHRHWVAVREWIKRLNLRLRVRHLFGCFSVFSLSLSFYPAIFLPLSLLPRSLHFFFSPSLLNTPPPPRWPGGER